MTKEIKKEFKYALRAGKLLILMASFMFFAVLTPLMLKVILPGILKSQLTGTPSSTLAQALCATVVLIALMIAITLLRLKRIGWNER